MTTRPFLWSVRRELWEYRSVWIAPVVVGFVALIGFLATIPGLATNVAELSGPNVEGAHNYVHGPYGAAAMLGFAVAFMVAVFYCLDGLSGEKRDRSVLFWKSLPVSDTTAVLAKATIPLVVLPALVFAVTAAAITIIATISALVLNRADTAMLFHHVQPVKSAIAALYAVVVIALWHAPLYAWLLFVSGWARRAALLWAVVPFLAIGALERILFQSWHFFRFLQFLLIGWATRAFKWQGDVMTDLMSSFAPEQVLATPSVWLGLVVAAVLLAGAIRMRRHAEPM